MDEAKETPQKSPTRARTYFQLFNPLHKKDIIKLIGGIKSFKLNEGEEEEDLLDVQELADDSSNLVPESLILNLSVSDGSGLTCTTCEVNFLDVQVQRLHFQLDWHRYNVKRRVHGQKPVDDVQFDEMMDGLSSISGSEDESESIANKEQVARLLEKVEESFEENEKKEHRTKDPARKLKKSPKIFFENEDGKIISAFRTIFSKNNVKPWNELDEFLTKPPKWGVILCGSGHFAAAIFEGGKDVVHKTFHTYTVRAKQGGAESSTGLHKSAGSSLRRHNEATLFQNIQDLLGSWKGELDSCRNIYYRMGSSNQNVLFDGKNPPFKRNDLRLNTIPFPTKRPTFSEVKKILNQLTTLQTYSKTEFMDKFVSVKKEEPSLLAVDPLRVKPKSKPKKKQIDRCRSRTPPNRDIIPCKSPSSSEDSGCEHELIAVDQEIDFSELQEFGDSLNPEERRRNRKRSRKAKKEEFQKPGGLTGDLLELLSSNTTLFVELLEKELKSATEANTTDNLVVEVNKFVDESNSTLLHLAARLQHHDTVWCLLESGCSPTVKDKHGKYAYNYAETKEGRNFFRKFRGQYPDKYDYQKAQIPEPLSEEVEQEKAERKRLANKLKREKEKQKKMERKEKQEEFDEKERFLNLSDREKRALAAERRKLLECKRGGEKLPTLIRCFECGVDITGKVPFEYNGNVFCNTKCLAIHRKKFPTPLSV